MGVHFKSCSKMHLLFLLLLPLLGSADQFYPAPTDQSEATFTEWWSEFTLWRDQTRDSLNLSLYSAPGLQWAATSFIQPQGMLHDRFLYDRVTGQWTVSRFLEDLKTRYGGVDSLLLWQGYPKIGSLSCKQLEFGFFSLTFLGIRTQTQQDRIMS